MLGQTITTSAQYVAEDVVKNARAPLLRGTVFFVFLLDSPVDSGQRKDLSLKFENNLAEVRGQKTMETGVNLQADSGTATVHPENWE